MESLYIEGTEIYPTVILDPVNDKFEIKGKCIPSDGKYFFEPILTWIEKYAHNPNSHTHFVFNLEFFNISSSKMLLFILYKLNDIKSSGKSVKITWYYKDNDDDMYEVGEDYSYMIDVPFNFVLDSEKSKKNLSTV
jgi:hypothetical protein